MSRPLLLALDLGTTSVRALVVDAERGVVARAARRLATCYPAPGLVEHDPEALWRESRSVLHEALARAGREAGSVAALGLASQRATVLAWDARSGAPLAPALGWQDQRTAPRAAELAAQGNPIGTNASATKFEWLLRNVPEVREAASAGRLRLGTPDAWLGFRLSAGRVFATDPGHASCTGLYDLRGGDWSERALARFGLERSWLPSLAATSEVLGESDACLFGTPIPLAARAGDQQAATFAHGALEAGTAKLTLGTAAMLDQNTGVSIAPPGAGAFPLALWRLADGTQRFCLEASVWTAGAAVDWLVEFGLLDDFATLERLAGGTGGVSFVPALQGLGAPRMDADARGLFGGITRGTTRAHLVAAVLDGIAQRCADLCEALGLEGETLAVDGNLARSASLLQRLADLSGLILRRAAEPETTALGAAFLAGRALGDSCRPHACEAAGPAWNGPEPPPVEPRLDARGRDRARERWRHCLERVRSARP